MFIFKAGKSMCKGHLLKRVSAKRSRRAETRYIKSGGKKGYLSID